MRRALAHFHSMASFRGRHRVLHLTWFAFFLTFVVWFNMAPFATVIAAQLSLSGEQMAVLALCNVALTVPARILVGMLIDRVGPRRVYAYLLMFSAVPCTLFATATSFSMLVGSRLAVSVVGAGFVVGIRMVAEWFPPREIGGAEGIYGGWGNFGAAAAALALPTVAAIAGGPDGWRWAIGLTGVVSATFGAVYLRAVSDTPDGVRYARPKRHGALEVTHPAAVAGLIMLLVPLTGALVLLVWRLRLVGFLSAPAMWAVCTVLVSVFAWQVRTVVRVNRPALSGAYTPADQYPLRSLAVLSLAYSVTFGSELAVVSMLPSFFASTWSLTPAVAGAAGSAFAVLNVVTRPGGGFLSDAWGSRRGTLAVLMAGGAAGFALLAGMGAAWPLGMAVLAALVCSTFVQAGNGAVFAMVPLVKRRVTGQIAGLVGAYGNVGALAYLTVMLLWGARALFVTVAASALVSLLTIRMLPEPADAFADEHAPDTGDLETAMAAG